MHENPERGPEEPEKPPEEQSFVPPAKEEPPPPGEQPKEPRMTRQEMRVFLGEVYYDYLELVTRWIRNAEDAQDVVHNAIGKLLPATVSRARGSSAMTRGHTSSASQRTASWLGR